MFYKQILSINKNPTCPTPGSSAGNKHLWYTWIIVAVILFFLQASTVDVLPSLMQDEAQITDYGRLALDPLSRWSVTWWVAGDKPLLLWSYLGPLFAELGYQIGGPTGVGPRIVALLGGLVAASIALGWLRERNVPAVFAALLATVFLLDPLFTLSQRMARSDSWVIALCLGSCLLLRFSARTKGKSRFLYYTFSGTLAAVALFVWPSAVFLYPLIILELLNATISANGRKSSYHELLQAAAAFAFGGILISIILIIPIRHQLVIILDDMKNMIVLNVNATKTPLERFGAILSYPPWVKLAKAFVKTLSPFLPLLAGWAVISKRDRGLIIVMLLTIMAIFSTLVYEFRLLYLLPYFLALSGTLFSDEHYKSKHKAIRRLNTSLVILAVLWSMCISIALRSALALSEGPQRKRNLITEAATAAIGSGNYKVFLAFTYEFYFTGRSLGWQLYTPYIQFSFDEKGNWIRKDDYKPTSKFIKLMSQMDYAIFSKNGFGEELAEQLEVSGMKYRGNIHISDENDNNPQSRDSGKMQDIFIWYLSGAPSYGPYILYARPASKVASTTNGAVREQGLKSKNGAASKNVTANNSAGL